VKTKFRLLWLHEEITRLFIDALNRLHMSLSGKTYFEHTHTCNTSCPISAPLLDAMIPKLCLVQRSNETTSAQEQSERPIMGLHNDEIRTTWSIWNFEDLECSG
jgi:hypothetical protein